jgi:hypothetical protein
MRKQEDVVSVYMFVKHLKARSQTFLSASQTNAGNIRHRQTQLCPDRRTFLVVGNHAFGNRLANGWSSSHDEREPSNGLQLHHVEPTIDLRNGTTAADAHTHIDLWETQLAEQPDGLLNFHTQRRRLQHVNWPAVHFDDALAGFDVRYSSCGFLGKRHVSKTRNEKSPRTHGEPTADANKQRLPLNITTLRPKTWTARFRAPWSMTICVLT